MVTCHRIENLLFAIQFVAACVRLHVHIIMCKYEVVTYERRLAEVANLSCWKQASIHFPISCDHTPFVILNILPCDDCFIIIITIGNEHPNLNSEKSFTLWTENVVANTMSLRNYAATVVDGCRRRTGRPKFSQL